MAVISVDPFDFQAPFPIDLRMRVADLNARNGIVTNARWEGMQVWVISEQALYLLVSPLADNASWRQIWPATAGSTANVSWGAVVPPNTSGNNGDIAYVELADRIDLYFKVGGVWGAPLGSFPKASTPTYTLDPSVPTSGTLAYLNSTYPSAKVGDIVALELSTQLREWTCYSVDPDPNNNKWAYINKSKQT